ncbi:MAG: hypothetical protein ACI36X_02825 [Bacteroidaceae bacterium]
MRKFLLMFLLIGFCTNCDDSFVSSIPDVTFRLECDMRQAAYSVVRTPGQFVSVDKNNHGYRMGYAGLLVGQSAYTGMNNEPVYYALDRACPVEVSTEVAVTLKSGTAQAVCPRCGTVYDLNNGGAPSGQGREFLKRYTVTCQGDILVVSSR